MGKREIKTGKGVRVTALDELRYYYFSGEEIKGRGVGDFGFIKFQDGLIKDVGANGCQPEDVLRVVLAYVENIPKGSLTFENMEKNNMLIDDLRDMLWLMGLSDEENQIAKGDMDQLAEAGTEENKKDCIDYGRSDIKVRKGL